MMNANGTTVKIDKKRRSDLCKITRTWQGFWNNIQDPVQKLPNRAQIGRKSAAPSEEGAAVGYNILAVRGDGDLGAISCQSEAFSSL